MPNIPTAGPPTTLGGPGAKPAVPADTGPISAAVEADLARLAAIDGYQQASVAVAADTEATALADRHVLAAQAIANRALRHLQDSRLSSSDAKTRLQRLAVAAYTGETAGPVAPSGDPAGTPQVGATPVGATPVGASPTGASPAGQTVPDPTLHGASLPSSQEAQDAGVTLKVVMSHQEQAVRQRSRQMQTARAAFNRAAAVVTRTEGLMATARDALATTQATLAALVTVAKGSAVPAPTVATTTVATTTIPAKASKTVATPSTSASAASAGGTAAVNTPTILGPSTLTAAELAGWFAAAGYSANATVPIGELAQDYLSAGAQTGVRGDLAFAQSIIETGDFSFPTGGQLTAADNNFAGIGACDSCATGWKFPDAQTGVSAQEELLEVYASPQKVVAPLLPAAGVGGCCRTWVALAGTWASSLTYGVEILTVYKQLLDWAIVGRLVAAGLTPAPAPGALAAAPVTAAAPATAASPATATVPATAAAPATSATPATAASTAPLNSAARRSVPAA